MKTGIFVTPQLMLYLCTNIWEYTLHRHSHGHLRTINFQYKRKALLCIKQYQNPFGYFSHNEYFKLFDSLVKLVLCYASQVWGFCYVNAIETVHLDFCKRYFGLNKSTNNAVVLGECGRLPLCISYMSNCIKYWCKLLHMPNSRYP